MKDIKLDDIGRAISVDEIVSAGRRLNTELPDDYVKFIAKHNGGIPDKIVFPIENMPLNPDDDIHRFLRLGTDGHGEFKSINTTFSDIFPNGIVCIGVTSSGNFIVIDTREGKRDVKLWDKYKYWKQHGWNESQMYYISNNFQEFVNSLRYDDRCYHDG